MGRNMAERVLIVHSRVHHASWNIFSGLGRFGSTVRQFGLPPEEELKKSILNPDSLANSCRFVQTGLLLVSRRARDSHIYLNNL